MVFFRKVVRIFGVLNDGIVCIIVFFFVDREWQVRFERQDVKISLQWGGRGKGSYFNFLIYKEEKLLDNVIVVIILIFKIKVLRVLTVIRVVKVYLFDGQFEGVVDFIEFVNDNDNRIQRESGYKCLIYFLECLGLIFFCYFIF